LTDCSKQSVQYGIWLDRLESTSDCGAFMLSDGVKCFDQIWPEQRKRHRVIDGVV